MLERDDPLGFESVEEGELRHGDGLGFDSFLSLGEEVIDDSIFVLEGSFFE